ncbi:ParM/StbA family protein [Iningainema tapete]|uniref:Actin-like protein N-terminal domain-containing protein n=1 Tax=Iningainema tapete BLCC-T55 TaxID=2748662 RepID=A0A8J6XA70_9CYAN|nr:hypothetical protein [Iningainema tapete]MBD2770960.1 hypothetical protein [Iningainema tapete BLCC-T55]
MIAIQPTQAETSQTPPPVPVGVDTGAGSLKLAIAGTRVRTPSKVVEVNDLEDDLKSSEGGYFFYQDGERTDLISKQFLTGSLASWKAPTTHTKLSDDSVLKVEYSLHTLLGGLATLPYAREWNLHLVLSIHNSKLFKDALASKINGSHIVSFGSKNSSASLVNLNVSLVVPEGAGSYSYCVAAKPEPLIDRTAQAIAIDFGTSTVIPTVFAPGGAIIHRQVLEVGGCIDLLEAIAADPELIQFLGTGKAGSVETIRLGVESGDFQYGTRSYNFRHIYARHLTPWLKDRLRLAFKEIAEWRDVAQSFVAWGGGVQMPGVSKMLQSLCITPVPDACWANALGLERMAAGRLARGK